MSKFWTVVTALFVVGLGLVFVANDTTASGIEFTDLETECRYDRQEDTNIELNEDNSLTFSGFYPVKNTNSELGFDYSKSDNRIVLNVHSENLQEPESFVDACLGSVIYEARTSDLEEGEYEITVRHDSRKIERQVIRVR